MLFEYDDNNKKSILNYAKKLKGKTFNDVKKMYEESPFKTYENFKEGIFCDREYSSGYYKNDNAKGELGGFLEKCYFGYEPNSKQNADFEKVGVELKVTPLNLKKNGDYSAGERLSITNISYNDPVEENFFNSHVWDKMKLILLIHYLRDKLINKMDYEIKFINYFTPSDEDLNIILDDYNKINAKIKAGKAHELSEGETLYLGACTKGSTAFKSMRPQYYDDKTLAKKRNFCFKRSYMDYVLNTFILKNKVPYESIIKDQRELENCRFEDFIIKLIDKNKGKTDMQLCMEYNRVFNNNKSQWIDLTYKMLGIKGNRAEEFIKAGIVVKAIRIEENGSIRENMSFPPFLFKTLSQEQWEDSTLFRYFDETRFLFVIYKKEGMFYKLLGAQIWNMPYEDLNKTVFKGWKETQKCVKKGVEFKKINNKMKNNLPNKRDNSIIHVRPHAKKAAYKLKDGYMQGNIYRDANELPNGDWMTTQSFWINNSYILSQLKFK